MVPCTCVCPWQGTAQAEETRLPSAWPSSLLPFLVPLPPAGLRLTPVPGLVRPTCMHTLQRHTCTDTNRKMDLHVDTAHTWAQTERCMHPPTHTHTHPCTFTFIDSDS